MQDTARPGIAGSVAAPIVRRPASAATKPRRLMPRGRQGQAYVAPAMLLIAFVLIAPSLYGFYDSLFNIRYLKAVRFVGFDNYRNLITDPDFLLVVRRSIVFTVFAVTITIAVALAISSWIDQLKGWFALAVQIVVVIPWVVSQVVGALLFRWVYVNDLGVGMYLLQQIGIKDFRPLSEPVAAMIALIGYACWRTLGFAMLLLLAGLKSVPAELYEAAHVDGASAWQRFTRISLPMLRTPVLITLVILTVSNLNNVEAPLIVTGGGPADATNILPLDLYVKAFAQYDFNTATALGIGMFVANILLALAYVGLVGRHG